MKSQLSAAVIVLSFLARVPLVAAAPIYLDEFTTDPGSNGWTVSLDGNMTATSNGSELVFARPANASNGTASYIQKSISTYGYSGVTAAIFGGETGDLEPQDYIRLQVNLADGNGWQNVAPFPLFDDLSGGAFSYPALALPAGAANNSYLQARISVDFNAASETYSLASFGLNGAATGAPLNAVTQIFADNGSVDPAANGWTEVTASANQNSSSDGSVIRFTRSVDQPQEDMSITRTIDTTGSPTSPSGSVRRPSGVVRRSARAGQHRHLDAGVGGHGGLLSPPPPAAAAITALIA